MQKYQKKKKILVCFPNYFATNIFVESKEKEKIDTDLKHRAEVWSNSLAMSSKTGLDLWIAQFPHTILG